MKDPVKLTHSHVEIQNMLDELESVHFPSQEFQNMVDLLEAADKKRNEPKEDMDVSALQEYYAALEDSYDKLQKAARAYIDKKDRSSKGIEKNRTPEEEKRYRTAKAIAKYADEMGESSWYYRSELSGADHVLEFNKKVLMSQKAVQANEKLINKGETNVRPFGDDLDDITKTLEHVYEGLTGKTDPEDPYDKNNKKERGHEYFRAIKEDIYNADEDLRVCLTNRIKQYNLLTEKADSPVNGKPKIQAPDINSETFYEELRDAISQKENGKFKHTQKGRRAFLPGTETLGELTTQMYRFREAVKEVEKQKAVVEEHNTIQKSRQDQFVRPHVIETVEYMKKNPIGKQNDAELDACLKQIDSNLSTVNRTLQDCETGSAIYAYAQDRALEPLKDYMVSAVKRYNQMHEDTPIKLPSERENTRSFFTLLKKNASIMDPGGQIEAVAEKALKIASVELNERGKQYEAHAKQQREYKKLASQFKNEVDKSMFPSPAYKKMAELFKKAASAEAEPDPVKRAKVYQDLYNAASEYLLYKDPRLDGKAKKLSAYEEKRVKFAEDLREFCKRGGAKPENYDLKKEQRITNRQPYQPVKSGPNLG